jgi:hypothetical protein
MQERRNKTIEEPAFIQNAKRIRVRHHANLQTRSHGHTPTHPPTHTHTKLQKNKKKTPLYPTP